MKTIVVIPTYNESENIAKLIGCILKLRIKNLDILVIDDNSPDETWKIVKDISSKNKKVHLLLRKNKRGRGLAGKAGFLKALEMGADYVIEMDADFSHNPTFIPKLMSKMKECDMALGSRLVKGAKENERTWSRKLITALASSYVRLILGLKIKDCNSGFRCFKRKVLKSIISDINSAGPGIVQEVLYKAYLKGFSIKEVPISFKERKMGKSKLGLKQLIGGILIVLKLKFLK